MEVNNAVSEIKMNSDASLKMCTASSSSSQTLVGTPGSAAPHIPSPTISSPLPFISAQHHLINAPQLLPNFPQTMPKGISVSFDAKDIHLQYWQTGLYYQDPEITFRIESLTHTK